MTIINQTSIEELNILWVLIPGVIFILALTILCILSIFTPKNMSKSRIQTIYAMVGAIGLIIFLSWFGIASMFLKTPTDKYTYEVTFDNIETLNEWFDTKTFVEYNDGIYIFKDKTK